MLPIRQEGGELLPWALRTTPGAFGSEESSEKEEGVVHRLETISGRNGGETNETVLLEEGKTRGGLLGSRQGPGVKYCSLVRD